MSSEQLVSRTLRRMVETGRYTDDRDISNDFMCHVLEEAWEEGVIDRDSFRAAAKAIRDYLEYLQQDVDYDLRGDTLVTALRNNGLPSAPEDRAALYLDWDNRPLPYGEY